MINESFLVLDKYNFHNWEFELEGLCLRNKATDEFAKFSWLSESLNIVVSALSDGCDLPDKYLLKLFVQGCLEHRDLIARHELYLLTRI
jgi:hypothetical protein